MDNGRCAVTRGEKRVEGRSRPGAALVAGAALLAGLLLAEHLRGEDLPDEPHPPPGRYSWPHIPSLPGPVTAHFHCLPPTRPLQRFLFYQRRVRSARPLPPPIHVFQSLFNSAAPVYDLFSSIGFCIDQAGSDCFACRKPAAGSSSRWEMLSVRRSPTDWALGRAGVAELALRSRQARCGVS